MTPRRRQFPDVRVEWLDQVRPIRLVEIEHVFNPDKAFEDEAVEVVAWRDERRARDVLLADRAAWQDEPPGHGGGR